MRQSEVKRAVASHMEYHTMYSVYTELKVVDELVEKYCGFAMVDTATKGDDMVSNSKFYKYVKCRIINDIYDAIHAYLRDNDYHDLDRVIFIITDKNRSQFIVNLDTLSVDELQRNNSLSDVINKLIGYYLNRCFKTERMEMVIKGEVKHYRALPTLREELHLDTLQEIVAEKEEVEE